MNKQTTQLQLNLGFIAQQSIGYTRDFLFESPTLLIQPDLELFNFNGKIDVSRTSEGLLFQGEFRAFINSTCGRCLVDYKQRLKSEFAELYTFQSHVQEDTELIYPEDGQVDLAPVIREYLLLEYPINPVCKADCQGLCPICGNNLNHELCTHDPDPIDPRMEILKSLLDGE